jgi:hypothetical protein
LATQIETSMEIERLFGILPLSRGQEYDKIMPEFVRVCVPFEASHVREAVDRFIDGETADGPYRTAPKVPEFAAMVREIRTKHGAAADQALKAAQRALPAPSYAETSPGEKSRMALKMPMWKAAENNPARCKALAKANAEGLEAMVVLAVEWGVPIPPSLYEPSLEVAAQRWNTARNRIQASLEGSPPPYLRNRQAAEAKWAGHPVLHHNASYEQFVALSRKRELPVGATWVFWLGQIRGPKAAAA